MASTSKKVLVRRHVGGCVPGYLPASSFVRTDSAHGPMLDLLDLSGRTLLTPLDDVKYIAFVRDFNLDDPEDPERLTRRAFLARPRSPGLWIRIAFLGGDHLEGLASADASLIDNILTDRGLFLTPPDDRGNTQRVFVPRLAIESLQFLALINPQPVRIPPANNTQGDLFPIR